LWIIVFGGTNSFFEKIKKTTNLYNLCLLHTETLSWGTVGLHHKKAREKSIKIGRLQRRTDRKVNFRVKKHWTFIVESLKFFLKKYLLLNFFIFIEWLFNYLNILRQQFFGFKYCVFFFAILHFSVFELQEEEARSWRCRRSHHSWFWWRIPKERGERCVPRLESQSNSDRWRKNTRFVTMCSVLAKCNDDSQPKSFFFRHQHGCSKQ